MKNITGRTMIEDLNFVTAAINGTVGLRQPFIVGPILQVQFSVTNYQSFFISGAIAPIGLLKGQPKIEAQPAQPAKGKTPAKPAVVGQPAVLDSHEYYYQLYDSGRKQIKSELTALRKNYLGHICPYCGIDTATHIDHHLPRSAFPEFSISLQNLLMACDGCNTTYKGEKWGVGANKPFFHPAFDSLPSVPFLEANCAYGAKAITVNFSIIAGLPLTALLARHFKNMDLNERYIAKATFEEIPKMRNIILAEPTQARKVTALRKFAKIQIIAHEVTSWQRAYYLAIMPLVKQIAAGGL